MFDKENESKHRQLNSVNRWRLVARSPGQDPVVMDPTHLLLWIPPVSLVKVAACLTEPF